MINWVAAQFERWGVWLQTDRGVAAKGQMAAWLEPRGGQSATAMVPKVSIECSRVHDWVRGLDLEAQRIMLQVYCTEQSSIEHARVLHMSTRTLYARLHSLQVAYTRRDADRHVTREKIIASGAAKLVSPVKGRVLAGQN